MIGNSATTGGFVQLICLAQKATVVQTDYEASTSVPTVLVVLLIIGALTLSFSLYFRERGHSGRAPRLLLGCLRSVCLILVIWMLLGVQATETRSTLPELIIALDQSGSMQTVDSGPSEDLVSRFDSALYELDAQSKRLVRRLETEYQLRWVLIGKDSLELPFGNQWPPASAAEVAVDESASRLGDGIAQILSARSTQAAAIVLMSDGINTEGLSLTDAGDQARAERTPIVTIGYGRATGIPDLAIADVLADKNVYLGDKSILDVNLSTTNTQAGRQEVVLRDRKSGAILDQTAAELEANGQTNVRLRFQADSVGAHELAIEVEPLPGEEAVENNTYQLDITVQNRKIRVLLVFARPSYEYRFLKHWLERSKLRSSNSALDEQAAFEVTTILQDGAAMPLIPTTEAELSQYDAFIFGDFDPSLISSVSQDAMRKSVSGLGSGCLFIFGSDEPSRDFDGSVFADIAPLQFPSFPVGPPEFSYQWRPTALGLSAPPLLIAGTPEQSLRRWSDAPRIQALATARRILPTAQILAEADGGLAAPAQPLLVSNYYGAGRVVVQLTDESYTLGSVGGSDELYERYWTQMLRWLTRGRLRDPNIELTLRPNQARFGTPVQVRLSGSDSRLVDQPTTEVSVVSQLGDESLFMLRRKANSPGIFEGSLVDLLPGDYEVVWKGDTTTVKKSLEINQPPTEQSNLQSDHAALKDLAARSRGRFYVEGQLSKLLAELPKGTSLPVAASPPKPIWNQNWVAMLFVALLTCEWLLRRRVKML
ncbi:MAG TPA: hypothetical protein DDW52_01840 [Planctomycetaceae bacterium]|nr:hypothetical protein [Planctomycetaceae bacterium]